MGRRIIALAMEDPSTKIVAATEPLGSPMLGQDIGQLSGVSPTGIRINQRVETDFDVFIDFSTASATNEWLDLCVSKAKPIIIGTTGHSDADLAAIRDAAKRIPILKSANMSVGVNVLLRIAEELGRALDASYDVEIFESHHRFKTDAPSGTAIALRDAVIRGRGGSPPTIHGRQGQTGERPAGQIGMHSLRIGDTVGEHTVSFGNLGETISIAHSAHSRDTFAQGALRAAKWIVAKPPGLYQMSDVLFSK